MSKIIHLFSDLQHYADDQNTIEVNGNTVGECLKDLVRQFPRIKPVLYETDDKISPYAFISLNMKSSLPEEANQPVKDGDELYIALIFVGG